MSMTPKKALEHLFVIAINDTTDYKQTEAAYAILKDLVRKDLDIRKISNELHDGLIFLIAAAKRDGKEKNEYLMGYQDGLKGALSTITRISKITDWGYKE